MPEVRPGVVLGEAITDVAATAGVAIGPGDVVVLSQKIVSKAEGRLVSLDEVHVTARAHQMADRLDKDPRLVQVVLDQSVEVMRAERGVLITRTHHGLVCANAGVDQSNVPGDDVVCLLPPDPDASARAVRAQLGNGAAVVIADSFGRAWRHGQADVAIGCAGLVPLDDRRGTKDAEGRELIATMDAIADQAASAAALVRDKAGREGVVVVRGLDRFVTRDDGPGAAAIIRPPEEDLFH
jgi:coenzyme F420-0:L-glutamate ligase / coenzyme F420-1:gamma-L-glutamate ligase